MKIQTRLALRFTTITVGVLALVFVFVYGITSHSIDRNYQALLFDKALITAQKHFEEDELSQAAYQKVTDAYDDLLPETSERIVVADHHEEARHELSSFLTDKEIETLFATQRLSYSDGDQSAVAIYYPDNEGDFIVVVTAANRQGTSIKTQLRATLLIILLVSCVTLFMLLWWNAGVIIKPLRKMVARMQQISASDLHLRIDERKGNDELAQTARYFNEMIERLEISFNAQRTFIANASHELRNPLTAIVGECEVMQLKAYSSDEYQAAIGRIAYEIDRLNSLINSLLQMAQTDMDISESHFEELDLAAELRAVIAVVEQGSYRGRVRFAITAAEPSIKANKQLLFMALYNLIENACKYSTEPVDVALSRHRDAVTIVIADRGIGIPADEADKVFNTFYRARNAFEFKGSGIGLSLAQKILTLSHASLTLESHIGHGTRATITFLQ